MEEVLVNQLSMEMRLLPHIIGYIFFSRMARFDFMSKRDIMVMYHVVQVIHLNLPTLMLQ